VIDKLLRRFATYVARDITAQLRSKPTPVRYDEQRRIYAKLLYDGKITAKVYGTCVGGLVVAEQRIRERTSDHAHV
jgi:hypothetical protein